MFYYLFYRFVKNFFPSKYKNIILITLILFFFQFQFSDLYLLSLETNIPLRIIVLVFLIIFFIIFLVRKNFLKNFLSNLILIFSIFFIFKYVYGLYLNFSQIKNLNAEYKSEQSENLIKQTHINKNKNVYFIISDAVIDLDLFEKKYSKFLKDKDLVKNFRLGFLNEGFSIIDNSKNNTSSQSTKQTLGAVINLDDEIPINGSKYKYLYPIAMKFFSYSNLNKKLKEKNYNFFWIGNIWNNCHLYNADLCLYKDKYYNFNFYRLRTLEYYLEASYIGNFLFKIFNEKFHYKEINKHNSSLKNFINLNYLNKKEFIKNQNNFMFFHDYGAHPPFIYDQNCDFVLYPYNSKKGYAESYICNLKELLSFVKFINKTDPESNIIITGDHGYFEDRSNILRMIKFQNCEYDYNKISQKFSYLVSKAISCSSS